MTEAEIKEAWENPEVTKVLFNGTFECVWLTQRWGLGPAGRLYDPFVALHLLDENSEGRGLESVARRALGAPPWKQEFEPVKRAVAELRFFPDEYRQALEQYNQQDVYWTGRLAEWQRPQLKAQGLDRLFAVEMENLKTLARMTAWGILVDWALLDEWEAKYARRRDELVSGLGFNPASPPQCLAALHQAGYRTLRSTTAEVLARLPGPVPAKLLEIRKCDKILGTYLRGLREHIYADGRIHPAFHLARTVSGRLSSSEPNGQNFPRDIDGLPFRQLFRASPASTLLCVDHNQLELRVAGHYAGGKLLDVYRTGADIHSVTGERIWAKPRDRITDNERVVSKITNFTCLYDPFASAASAVWLQCQGAGIPFSRGDATSVVLAFRRTYPEWWGFYAGVLREVYHRGEVRAPTGRLRRSPLPRGQLFPFGPPPPDFKAFFVWCDQYDQNGKNLEKEVLRSLVNSMVQGLAADITKLAGTVLDRELALRGLAARLANNVHDELLADTPDGELGETARLAREVNLWPPILTAFGFILRVPLQVEIGVGATWSEAKKKENRLHMSS